jgi:hypothetical protein
MSLSDIVTDSRKDEEAAAVALCASLLTHKQIEILANLFAGARPDAIQQALLRLQPPSGMRLGPLLPYLVAGTLKEFPFYVNDVVVYLLGTYATVGDNQKTSELAVPAAAGACVANGRMVSVGAPSFYTDYGQGRANSTPAGLHRAAMTVSPQAVWSTQGLSEATLGAGFSGGTSLKGNLPDTARPSALGQTASRSVAADPVVAAANEQAANMGEPSKP